MAVEELTKRIFFGTLFSMDDDHQLVLRVKFYQTSSGREPVREWLNDLAELDRKAISDLTLAQQRLRHMLAEDNDNE